MCTTERAGGVAAEHDAPRRLPRVDRGQRVEQAVEVQGRQVAGVDAVDGVEAEGLDEARLVVPGAELFEETEQQRLVVEGTVEVAARQRLRVSGEVQCLLGREGVHARGAPGGRSPRPRTRTRSRPRPPRGCPPSPGSRRCRSPARSRAAIPTSRSTAPRGQLRAALVVRLVDALLALLRDSSNHESRGIPIAAALPVRKLMPSSWMRSVCPSASSPSTRVQTTPSAKS